MSRVSTPPKRIFIDTSAWIELMLKGEVYHEVFTLLFKAALKEKAKFFTSDYVLDEAWTRLITSQSFFSAKMLREKTLQAEKRGFLLVLWTDETVFDQAWKLFSKYSEHRLSFTDATIVHFMFSLKLDEVWTLDEGFKKVGLLVRPEIE